MAIERFFRRITGRNRVPTVEETLTLIAGELGLTADEVWTDISRRSKTIQDLVVNQDGRFRVLGKDRWDGSLWLGGEFDTPEEALAFAEEQTIGAMGFATDESVATVYHAYSPDGEHLGNNNPPWVDRSQIRS